MARKVRFSRDLLTVPQARTERPQSRQRAVLSNFAKNGSFRNGHIVRKIREASIIHTGVRIAVGCPLKASTPPKMRDKLFKQIVDLPVLEKSVRKGVGLFREDSRSLLSDFTDIFDDVVRDGEFYAVGKAETKGTNLLAPVWETKYILNLLEDKRVSAVVCTPGIAHQIPEQYALAVSRNPKTSAMLVAKRLAETPEYFWKNFDSVIPATCEVHPTAFVEPQNVILGERCKIGPNTVVLERTIIGNDVIIGPNCSVACDAFESYEVEGKPILMPQAGGVKIDDRTVILANTCIVRSSFASAWTHIEEDCIIDNLIHLAHDVVVGARSRLGACAEISGRVTIGSDSYVAPTAIIINGISLGKKTYVTMGSMVTQDVPDGQRVTGYFAEPHEKFMSRLKRRQFDT